jgi:hypothetical protein
MLTRSSPLIPDRPLLLLLPLLFTLPACTYPERGMALERLEGDLGLEEVYEAFGTPEMRFGTMPFDAWYSPLIPLGVDDLGHHAYVDPTHDGDRGRETSRGTLYTTRAGFLDIAHTRNAIDLTRFAFETIHQSFLAGEHELEMIAAEPDLYRVDLLPPAQWQPIAEKKKDPQVRDEIREASIEIAGRVSYLMTTWHEVLTFFGYKGLGIVTEKPSAFSFDDAASHRVGVVAAMRALRRAPAPNEFDQFVTEELRGYLEELGAVSAEEVVTRSDEVEGRFWDGDEPAFRVIDLGLDDQPLLAYVTDDTQPIQWYWPSDAKVGEHRIRDLFDLTIELNTFEAGAILEVLRKDEGPVHPRTDFNRLSEYLEAQSLPEVLIEPSDADTAESPT